MLARLGLGGALGCGALQVAVAGLGGQLLHHCSDSGACSRTRPHTAALGGLELTNSRQLPTIGAWRTPLHSAVTPLLL